MCLLIYELSIKMDVCTREMESRDSGAQPTTFPSQMHLEEHPPNQTLNY